MKKVLPFALVALLIPSVALAKGPNPNNQRGKAKVMYVLKGMLSNYTAYTPAANGNPAVDGQVTIEAQHSNRHGKLLVGQTITISTGANTTVLLKNGVTTIAASQPGDVGTVKIRAARLAFKSATLADVQNALLNQPAFQVADRGPAGSG